jgi:hypothetical protein
MPGSWRRPGSPTARRSYGLPSGHARQRVRAAPAPPLKRKRAADRHSHRIRQAAPDVRKPVLRPPIPRGRRLQGERGPNGSFGAVSPLREGETVRWQTPGRRRAEQSMPFTIGIGREDVPGVPPPTMQTAIYSDTAISWTATFHPFDNEIPADADWVSFTPTHDPNGEMGRVTDRWRWADESNPALVRAVPESLVNDGPSASRLLASGRSRTVKAEGLATCPLGFEGRGCRRYPAFAFTVIRDLRHTLRTVVGLSALKAVQERQITPITRLTWTAVSGLPWQHGSACSAHQAQRAWKS